MAKKLNSIEKARYIDRRYREYLHSSFFFKDEPIQKQFEEQLAKEDLFRGPYLSMSLPFVQGKSVNELIHSGVMSKEFRNLGDVHLSRPLYKHQEEAIQLLKQGRSVVVTTGTGSGKSESFLYPILDDILQDIEHGREVHGVRAIFLYPMNALLNDQVERVRKMLTPYGKITYGFYTGDTPETLSDAQRVQLSIDTGIEYPKNELLSRKEIRNKPPQLLFTNYSMLEYLLLRPSDCTLFAKENIEQWKFVVLDEAHTYAGSKGIEIAMLLRRLSGLKETKPTFILTSATLGEKGRSEQEIVDFATNLTAAPFKESDIIFAKRVDLDPEEIQYQVSEEDLLEMERMIEAKESIRPIVQKYVDSNHMNTNELLYDLLVHDKHVYNLSRILKKTTKVFDEVLKELIPTMSEEALVALCSLINKARRNGMGLYDLKYHSFVRPFSSGYVTLGKNVELSLTKTNELNGLKTFEIALCDYCNELYVTGLIRVNKETGVQYLEVESETSEQDALYESLEKAYFMLNDEFAENVKSDQYEPYEVCSKCGAIWQTRNLNKITCHCKDSYKRLMYKVCRKNASDTDLLYGKLMKCLSCGRNKNNSTILKSLQVGSDSGTAIMAQILLESMESDDLVEVKPMKLSLKPRTIPKPQEDAKVKQFLSFSDSRQKASYAAVFFMKNHTRLLRKRLIWKMIEDNGYEDIEVSPLVTQLSKFIQTKNLFDNDMGAEKNAWITVLYDLLRVDGMYDGEGVGLYYFDLDLSDLENALSEEEIRQTFPGLDISKKDFMTLIQVVFNCFKMNCAIDYAEAGLMNEEKLNEFNYRHFDNYYVFQLEKEARGTKKKQTEVKSFLPTDTRENAAVQYVKKAFQCTDEQAKNLLSVIFVDLLSQLKDAGYEPIFKIEVGGKTQIYAKRYVLKNYKTSKYYRCDTCGRLTPHNVHDVCVQRGCMGKLVEVDVDEVMKGNYYRDLYINKKIERIVGKEHTAQLERDKAKEYQNDFKNKKLNILFCSTTFEMGIDIGGLETVFMRNVPPTPANYVQRAGRAGRREDSSAFILTYCDFNSHDFSFYKEPEQMISGMIHPPMFEVLNDKIIRRHLMSSCLSSFFQIHPEYFKSLDMFLLDGGVEAFNDYILSCPKDLNEYINKRVLPEEIYAKYHDFNWFDGSDERLENLQNSVEVSIREYEVAKALQHQKGTTTDIVDYDRLMNQIKSAKVLDMLSRYSVIPRYGFPVDVVSLEMPDRDKSKKDHIKANDGLQRDLRIAISEFGPEAETVVDGKKVMSQYVILPKKQNLMKRFYCVCPTCKRFNIMYSDKVVDTCEYCGGSLPSELVSPFIDPVHGFKAVGAKTTPESKPQRNQITNVLYVGKGIVENAFELPGVLGVESSRDDELMVLSLDLFYICPECGYAVKYNRKNHLDLDGKGQVIEMEHYTRYGYKCNETMLRMNELGHTFKTDVVRFTIPMLLCVESAESVEYARALSFLYAFLEGMSAALDIERNDISGVVAENRTMNTYDILLYDDVPGGAGHVKRLLTKDAIVSSMKEAYKKVSKNCCDEDTSCYNCLRNYKNRFEHHLLKRKYAIEVLETLLKAIKD